MSLTVSTDLSVTTSPSQLEEKLEGRRNAMQESTLKGEPKIFGVSHIVLGFVIITYSIPLLSAETTLILYFGVPWWSGLVFVISGALAIAVEKHARKNTFNACLAVSIVAIIVSVTALILYFIDLLYNPITECKKEPSKECNRFYATRFSTGVKTTIFMIIMVQAATSSAFTAILYKQRNNFTGYANVNE